jgi:hypothetical protein
LILTRGVTRAQYLLAKAAAAFLSSGLVTLVGFGFFYLLAAIFLPPGRWVREPYPTFPGPWPELFQSSPLLNDLLAGAMLILAASTLSLVGLLLGIVLRNEYAAMAAPFLFVTIGAFALKSLEAVNPIVYLDLCNTYPRRISRDWLPYMAFVYWLSLGGVLLLVSHALFSRGELDS